jgi:chitin synthase
MLQQAWVWLLWLLSQTWITLHIWTPKAERLATTERLFVLPMYDSLLIDQSLGLNRRCDDEADVKTEVLGSDLCSSYCSYCSFHVPIPLH